MPTAHESLQASVLLVDDEANILRSLSRLLRGEDYRITLAESGDAALAILEQRQFDLILSDARMPGMDGATLLGHALRLYPDSIRILLTGYADMATTVKAVNEGQIFRYVSKPWNDDELRQTLRDGLVLQHSERERKRLSHIVAKQNKQLVRLNQQLHGQVKSRTSELEQTADMLDLTLEELKQSYMQATEVFGSLINLRMPPAQQLNARVVALSRAMAQVMDYSEAELRNLTMAASLYNIAKLSWDTPMLATPAEQMRGGQLAQLHMAPQLGGQILLGLEPMQDAARIIRHHQENWDGTGLPDRLQGNEIPQPSLLLRLAVDYVELQCGLLLVHRLSPEDAQMTMQRQIGRRYAPALFPVFLECVRQQAEPDCSVETIRYLETRRLLAGMVLGKNLYAQSGLLLLNEGKRLSAQIIDKLISFEGTERTEYRVPVLKSSFDQVIGRQGGKDENPAG